jgi:thiol-disulfide isomerase/thioredoxin
MLKRLIIIILPFIWSCNRNQKEAGSSGSQEIKKDSVITLEMHVRKGESFHFGFADILDNWTQIETPEKPDTSVYVRKIISHQPVFLRNNEYQAGNYFYVIPGETYKVTRDSVLSHFEVPGNPERTYEVNIQKELRKHILKLKKFGKYDQDETYMNMDLSHLDLKTRDSMLTSDHQENIRFIEGYASKNGFDPQLKEIILNNELINYSFKRLLIKNRMHSDKKIEAYLDANKSLYDESLKTVNCDSCFMYPFYNSTARFFARNYVADPEKKPVAEVYNKYKDFFKGKTRDYLLYELIKFGGMFNYTKPDPVLAKQFLVDAKDEGFKNYISEIYNFLEVKKDATGNLTDFSGKDMTWEKVLQKNKGKVIYADFWASWCGPCRREMPFSHQLQETLSGKDVVFLYVSLDENSVDWKKACDSEGLNKGESYLLIQPEESDLMKQYKITGIPRYFLIDKSGKVVNSNAQRPSDKNIVKEIQLLL